MRCEGVYTALLTPLNSEDVIDWDSLNSLLILQIESGVTGVILLGSTGEGHAFTEDEFWKILDFSIKKVAKKIEVVMGLPTNNTRQAVLWAKNAKKLGADGCLLATPYYNKPTQEGMIDHYVAVCEEGLPVMAYNVPSRTASQLSLQSLQKLSVVPFFAGLKDSSGSIDGASFLIKESSCKILCGNDSQTLPWMSLGSTGVVSVCSNILPSKIVSLVQLCKDNHWEKARKLHYQLLPIFDSLFCQPNPIPIKWVTYKKGIISSDNVRLPLLPLRVVELQQKVWNNFLLGDNNA